MALPVLHGGIRCPTGNAKLTGPSRDFGTIPCYHVIHAVGPNYHEFDDNAHDNADALLRLAYHASLHCAHQMELQEVAFSEIGSLFDNFLSIPMLLASLLHIIFMCTSNLAFH